MISAKYPFENFLKMLTSESHENWYIEVLGHAGHKSKFSIHITIISITILPMLALRTLAIHIIKLYIYIYISIPFHFYSKESSFNTILNPFNLNLILFELFQNTSFQPRRQGLGKTLV